MAGKQSSFKAPEAEPRKRRRRKGEPPPRRQATPRWVWPTIRNMISQQESARHQAVDISWPGVLNAPVFAPTEGVVQAIRYQPEGYGLNVRLTTTEGYTVILGHLQATAAGLVPGQQVVPGQLIGLVGSTGRSTGPHLHYEIRSSGHADDRFAPGSGSGVGAIDVWQFYGATPHVPSTDRTTPSTERFNFAPTSQPSFLPGEPSPSRLPRKPPGDEPPPSKTTPTERPRPTETGKTEPPPGDIRVGTVPLLGDITIPRPGKTFVQYALVALGVAVIIIGLILIARRKPGGGKTGNPGSDVEKVAGALEGGDIGKSTLGAAARMTSVGMLPGVIKRARRRNE